MAPIFQHRATKTSTDATNTRRDKPCSSARPPQPARDGRGAPVDPLGIRQRCQHQDIADSTIDAIHRLVDPAPNYDLKYNWADEVTPHSDIRTLVLPGTWISDQAKVNSSRLILILFNSNFFSRLLSDGDFGSGPANYDYSE